MRFFRVQWNDDVSLSWDHYFQLALFVYFHGVYSTQGNARRNNCLEYNIQAFFEKRIALNHIFKLFLRPFLQLHLKYVFMELMPNEKLWNCKSTVSMTYRRNFNYILVFSETRKCALVNLSPALISRSSHFSFYWLSIGKE